MGSDNKKAKADRAPKGENWKAIYAKKNAKKKR